MVCGYCETPFPSGVFYCEECGETSDWGIPEWRLDLIVRGED
jgi:hypothetical protein